MLLWTLLIFLSVGFTYGDSGIRIVGGTLASNLNHPYQLSLEKNKSGEFDFHCGAVIIDSWWALTAAHCVYGDSPERFRLRSGTSFLTGGYVHEVKRIIAHKLFNAHSFDYDIALLQVSKPFKARKGVKMIPLAKKVPPTGSRATITGWGVTEEYGSTSNELMKSKVFIVDPKKCQELYPSHVITKTMLCAAGYNYTTDSCQGDSGGPVVANGTLTGLVSWAVGCSKEDQPGVNTNIAVLRDWIIKNMQKKP